MILIKIKNVARAQNNKLMANLRREKEKRD